MKNLILQFIVFSVAFSASAFCEEPQPGPKTMLSGTRLETFVNTICKKVGRTCNEDLIWYLGNTTISREDALSLLEKVPPLYDYTLSQTPGGNWKLIHQGPGRHEDSSTYLILQVRGLTIETLKQDLAGIVSPAAAITQLDIQSIAVRDTEDKIKAAAEHCSKKYNIAREPFSIARATPLAPRKVTIQLSEQDGFTDDPSSPLRKLNFLKHFQDQSVFPYSESGWNVGARIAFLKPQSVFSKMGLEAGDIILLPHQVSYSSSPKAALDWLKNFLEQLPDQKTGKISVVRGDTRFDLEYTIEIQK